MHGGVKRGMKRKSVNDKEEITIYSIMFCFRRPGVNHYEEKSHPVPSRLR